ncbi:MAG: winged helix-turn-helix transcriptional regulator [Nanoarchaeota archaeon]|nr:winged helix-turn-helix transcriptional regulator [Nanoarchaeota archaeon]
MIRKTYIHFFKTLSDPTKLDIIKTLREGPKSVLELSSKLKLEQSRASHNLRKLNELGFVTVTPNGKQRIYDIDKKTILPLLKIIDGHVDVYYKHYCRCKGNAKKERWEGKGEL